MGDLVIEVRVQEDEPEQELRSLADWLKNEPDIRRHASIALESGTPEPGGLGGASVEVIQLVVDAGFQLSNLALAFAAWKATRRNAPVITVRVDGDPVDVSSSEGLDGDT